MSLRYLPSFVIFLALVLNARELNGQSFIRAGLSRALTVTSNATLDYCADFGTETNFTTWDEIVAVRYLVAGGKRGDVVRIDWIPPEGAAIIYRQPPAQTDYSGCYAWVLGVATEPRVLGDWRVRVLINEQQLFTQQFRLSSAPPSPLSYTISKIPSYVPNDVDMTPLAIHNGGQIVFSTGSSLVPHFITSRAERLSGGTPLSGLPGTDITVQGIDVREGTIFGSTLIGTTRWGFQKSNDVTLYSFPGAVSTEIRGTWKVNNIRVGRYAGSDGVAHGFVHIGGFNRFEPRGAVSSEANAINAKTEIVGSFTDSSGVRHGYLWRISEPTHTVLDIPGAKSTEPRSLNDGSQVAGSFIDSSGKEHGFVWNAGAFRQLDIPGATMTRAHAINGSGQVVGVYREGTGPLRGFAAHLADRPLSFCAFDVQIPNAEVPIGGGTQEMRVVTSPGCNWPVFSDVPWLRLLPLDGLAGPGRVRMTTDPNAGPSRTANVYVWWLRFPVSQQGTAGSGPVITGTANGASFAPTIPSGGWFVINGTGLSKSSRIWKDTDFSDGRLPTSLDGVSVKIRGVDGYPYFVSPTQLNVLAPFGLEDGNATIEVTGPNGKTTTQGSVRRLDPAFFLVGPAKDGLAPAAAIHPDGTLVGETGSLPGVASRPATVGDTIILFGTGFGPATPNLPSGTVVSAPAVLASQPTIRVGGRTADVLFAGIVSSGLVQINLRIPEGLGPGIHAVTVDVDGHSPSAVAGIAVQ